MSFSLYPQEFVCVLGPSGSGKTTLLRVLAGLRNASRGRVQFCGGQSSGSQPNIGLVFQQANLMPWRTVLENILLPLELRGEIDTAARQRAAELIELIGLQGFEDVWPRDLSGGMAQRVALARALIQDPD
ncbi:ATP-binding cassette domain-containing protein, partial [bacterium]|nr:ATP-binding cassette domain-containing protein [bacterium]